MKPMIVIDPKTLFSIDFRDSSTVWLHLYDIDKRQIIELETKTLWALFQAWYEDNEALLSQLQNPSDERNYQ